MTVVDDASTVIFGECFITLTQTGAVKELLHLRLASLARLTRFFHLLARVSGRFSWSALGLMPTK